MRMRLFRFSLCDQASNWLERLPAGSNTPLGDLTTRFLAQFFPPGRTAKLRNDILMFQQHHGESLSEAWTRFKDLLQKVPHHGIDLWLQLRDLNPEESWAILEDLALYDNESWNDPRDFAKPVKAITLPQDVPSTSAACLFYSKINGPHDTQNCMENPEQAFVEYASSRTDEAGGLSKIAVEKESLATQKRNGAWHAKIRLIDPDGEEFTKTLQSIPTTRKLSERESPREIHRPGPLLTTLDV
ncbi:MAK10-like protein [Tanacetum coccineum]